MASPFAARIIELCERFKDTEAEEIVIDIALSQEELAGWTGSSLEAVVKALRRLRDAHWITTQRRGLIVHDLAALRRLAA